MIGTSIIARIKARIQKLEEKIASDQNDWRVASSSVRRPPSCEGRKVRIVSQADCWRSLVIEGAPVLSSSGSRQSNLTSIKSQTPTAAAIARSSATTVGSQSEMQMRDWWEGSIKELQNTDPGL